MIALERASTPIRRDPTSDMKGLNTSDLELRDTAETRSGEVTIYNFVLRTGRVNMGTLIRALYISVIEASDSYQRRTLGHRNSSTHYGTSL